MNGWIGFDLDGTLAEYHGWVDNATIGKPIKSTVDKLKEHLANGDVVRIFTARYYGIGLLDVERGYALTEEDVCGPIRAWCREHIGRELEITNVKDFAMIMLYDDRCVSVQANTGLMLDANARRE